MACWAFVANGADNPTCCGKCFIAARDKVFLKTRDKKRGKKLFFFILFSFYTVCASGYSSRLAGAFDSSVRGAFFLAIGQDTGALRADLGLALLARFGGRTGTAG
jgi:hypothetical protein